MPNDLDDLRDEYPVVGSPDCIPLLQCAKCGGEHPVHDSNPRGITWVRCSGNTYIVGVDMKGCIGENHGLAGSTWKIGKF